MKTQTRLGLSTLLGGALLAAASSAQAIAYDITSDHATGGLGTPPFGTVTLTQNGAAVDVTVHLFSGYSFITTGSSDFMDFKFNATGVALGDITIDQNATYDNGNQLVASTGTYNGDGTGFFGFGISGVDQKDGFAGAFNTDISFHVASATIADLTVPNNLGILFVADLYSATTGNTGPADVTPLPDGGVTAFLLCAGVAGLSLLRLSDGRVRQA
jgi:hypothetical protein